MADRTEKTMLLIGASRGLGYAMAEEYLRRGRTVVATERSGRRSRLHDLTAACGGRLEIETVDINEPDQINALHARLAGRLFDLLFVNAGVIDDGRPAIGAATTDEFVRVMVTNALSPMRVIERFYDLVTPAGTVGLMSSGLGSVAENLSGGYEVYRASKAALNTLLRSFGARHDGDGRALLLMAPGWVRTDMGGPEASLSVEQSIPKLVATIEAQAGKGGVQYLDFLGRTVAW